MSSESACVILTYHSIADGYSPLRIPPSLFARQVNWLKSNSHVLPLSEIVQSLANHRPLPRRSVALTFDDGFLDFYSHAAPVLSRAGCSATVFLPTGFCGATNRWPGQPSWVEEQPLMGWQHVSELAQQGFTFGAHTVSHPDLTKISESAARQEIAAGKQDIERNTGCVVDFFCYPYGRWNSRVHALVSEHYRAACSTRTAMLTSDADLLVLPRVDVHLLRHPAIFHHLFDCFFPAYLFARRTVRRLRGMPESVYGN